MIPLIELGAVVVLALFAVYMILLFGATILEIVINVPILWVLYIRGRVEISHGRKNYYLIALLISSLVFVVFWNFKTRFFIWWITQYALLIFLLAQLVWLIDRNMISKSKNKR